MDFNEMSDKKLSSIISLASAESEKRKKEKNLSLAKFIENEKYFKLEFNDKTYNQYVKVLKINDYNNIFYIDVSSKEVHESSLKVWEFFDKEDGFVSSTKEEFDEAVDRYAKFLKEEK